MQRKLVLKSRTATTYPVMVKHMSSYLELYKYCIAICRYHSVDLLHNSRYYRYVCTYYLFVYWYKYIVTISMYSH